jgi:hypothetical protein
MDATIARATHALGRAGGDGLVPVPNAIWIILSDRAAIVRAVELTDVRSRIM